MAREKILEVKNLVTKFKTDSGLVSAVQGVSFDLYRGQTLGIVGESGSGKSVTALSIMGLIPNPPGFVDSGEVFYNGKNLLELAPGEMRKIRGNKIAMIFQEPMTSLNPVYTVGNQIQEVLILHQKMNKKQSKQRSIELLDQVGIPSPEKRFGEYPHQLSGGMRQRVMIAMALACDPDILIADEPTTALDVTIQAQILDLMKKLQDDLGMAIILITHDLGVVAETCHEVNVMYCGKIVEQGPVETLFKHPSHPYTVGLMNSIPSMKDHQKAERLTTIRGMVPPLSSLPSGCSFQNRCDYVTDQCRQKGNPPCLRNLEKNVDHSVACFHPIQR